MSAINSPVDLADLFSGPAFLSLPDVADGTGKIFDYYYPRFNETGPADRDVILGAILRVKSWNLDITYSTQVFKYVPNQGYVGQDRQSNTLPTLVLASVAGTGGDTEQSSLLNGFAYYRNRGILNHITKQFSDTSRPAPISPCVMALTIAALYNAGAQDPDYPLFITFSLEGGVLLPLYSVPIECDIITLGDDGETDDPSGVDQISFLSSSQGPLTWNLSSYSPYLYDPSQSTSGTPDYTTGTVTKAAITPKEYFSWDGTYDTTTGARL